MVALEAAEFHNLTKGAGCLQASEARKQQFMNHSSHKTECRNNDF